MFTASDVACFFSATGVNNSNGNYALKNHNHLLNFPLFHSKICNLSNTEDRLLFHLKYTFFRKLCDLQDNIKNYDRAGQATDDNIIQRFRFACRINKAINTHSENVTLIAFPQQQWIPERPSMLRYTFTACIFPANSTHVQGVLMCFNVLLTVHLSNM